MTTALAARFSWYGHGHWDVTVKRRTVFPGHPWAEPYVKKT
jgi:hypothetical protein